MMSDASGNHVKADHGRAITQERLEQGIPSKLAHLDSADLIAFLESDALKNVINKEIDDNNSQRDAKNAVPIWKKLTDWKYISGGVAVGLLVFGFASENIFKPFAQKVVHEYLNTNDVVATSLADIEKRIIENVHWADRTVYATTVTFETSDENTGFEFSGTDCDMELARKKISEFVQACPKLVRNISDDEIASQGFSAFEGQTVHVDIYAHRRVMKLALAENCDMSGETARSCIKSEELRHDKLQGLEVRVGDEPIDLVATNNIHEEKTPEGSIFFRHFKGSYTIPERGSDDSPKRIRLLELVRSKADKDIMQATLHLIMHVTRNKELDKPAMPQVANAGSQD